jgi:hypothetical protein
MNWTAEIQFNTIYVLAVIKGSRSSSSLFMLGLGRKLVCSDNFLLVICRYSAFDALQLVSYTDEYFHCETCNGELVAEDDKLASEEMGDGDDNVRKRRREKLKDMQQRIEVSPQLSLELF